MCKESTSGTEEKLSIMCENLSKEIKEKICQISDELKVNENTVYLTFKSCLSEVEEQLRKEV